MGRHSFFIGIIMLGNACIGLLGAIFAFKLFIELPGTEVSFAEYFDETPLLIHALLSLVSLATILYGMLVFVEKKFTLLPFVILTVWFIAEWSSRIFSEDTFWHYILIPTLLFCSFKIIQRFWYRYQQLTKTTQPPRL